jgi:integrase
MGPISELYADHPATKFGPKEYRACREWWVRRGVSRQYANKQAKRLKRAIKWAVGEGLMTADSLVAINCVEPLKRGRTAAKETDPIEPVPTAIVEATLTHLSKVMADMVRLQRLLGCRPGEICKLTPSMIDRTSEVWEIQLADHKTAYRGKSRIIYAGPKAQAILRPYLLRAADAFCFSPQEATKQRLEAKRAARVTPLSCGNRPGTNVVRKPTRQFLDEFKRLNQTK